jgi:hypothetical protein
VCRASGGPYTVWRSLAVAGARLLEWIVVYTDPQGFAQQKVVIGELLPNVTMDADARIAAH